MRDQDFVRRGLERIKRVDQAAESLVTEMGLPKDAKYGLMGAAYGGQEILAAEAATQPALAPAAVGQSEERRKGYLYQLVSGFLATRPELRETLEEFRLTWDLIQEVSLERLAGGFASQQPTFRPSLAFTEGSGTESDILDLTIGVASWAILYQSASEDQLAAECRRRGLSPELSRAFAQFQQAHRTGAE